MNLSPLCIVIAFAGLLTACTCTTQKPENTIFEKGTFGYDLKLLKSKDSVIVLSKGDALVIVSPKYQGKVFTSTATGLSGRSFGWINYAALQSDTLSKHINAFGGEERMWLGPEGGQFSLFFAPGSTMTFDNWQTPPALDSEPWDLVAASPQSVSMQKRMNLQNYSGTTLNAFLERTVHILDEKDVNKCLGIVPDSSVKWVGFTSENSLTNTGSDPWTKEKGALCIWMLGMFNPSDSGTVIIPYNENPSDKNTKIATTDYFGEIPTGRIKTDNGLLYFKADGKYRSKLGLSATRAKSLVAGYDAINKVLTLIQFNKPKTHQGYINQHWLIQDEPFSGDVINTYNDGPLENGTQLGPFYELETSSPAAFLAPGERISHTQSVFHFTGDERRLSTITEQVLGISIAEIKNALP